MKPILIFFCSLCLLKAGAQTISGGLTLQNYVNRTAIETNAMASRLTLTPQQKSSLFLLNQNHLYGIALLGSAKTSLEERAQQIASLDSVWKAGLKNVMTESKYNEYFEDKEDKRNSLKQKMDSLKTAHPHG